MKQAFYLFDFETKSQIQVEATKSGREWKALCPKHEDKSPSLSINDEKGTFHCFGCGFSGSLYDPSKDPARKENKSQRQIVTIYDYQDETEKVVFQTVRYNPKDFSQRRPDGNGGSIWNLQGIEPILYRLPELLNGSDPVFITEGEKDVDRAISEGLTATTNPMGAGKWRPSYNQYLKNRDAVILPDNDDPGRNHASRVARSIQGIARTVKIVNLPGLPEKGDLSDWLNNGGSKNSLLELVESTPLWTGEKSGLILPTFAELASLEIKIEWIFEKAIPKNSVIVIHGPGGIRKTWLLLQVGSAIADGRTLFGLAALKTPVYYVDFENSLATLCDRARILGPSEMKVWHISNPLPPPRFDSDDWNLYKSLSPGVIIIDTHRSSNFLDENSSKDQALLMARHKELREMGFTVILIHHTAKANDRQYKGSTAIQDLCDVVLGLERVRGIGSEEAADDDESEDLPFRFGVRGKTRFEPFSIFLKFDPSRGFYLARDPDEDTLFGMQDLLSDFQKVHGKQPNQTEFFKLAKTEMDMNRKRFRRFLTKGDGRFWTKTAVRQPKTILYCPVVPGQTENQKAQRIENIELSHCSNRQENNGDSDRCSSYPRCSPVYSTGDNGTTERIPVEVDDLEDKDEGE